MHWLEKHWQRTTRVSLTLLPLSWIYCGLIELRRLAYRWGLKRVRRLPVPVVVVGNITVGGVGKTPLVCWLVALLQRAGYRPGVVSRGYGGQARSWPRTVTPDSDPGEVGDEPVLLARRAGCPIVVGPDRMADGEMLLRLHPCNVIIADDGLQHLALARDVEIAVIDGERRFGNGYCLPAGPLREMLSRLQTVDVRVCNGVAQAGELGMTLAGAEFHQVREPKGVAGPQSFRAGAVHAVAGIGNPQRFFTHLRGLGLEINEHAYPDHHLFTAEEICFPDSRPVIMTEKDAVKCAHIADERHWYLPVEVHADPRLGEIVLRLLRDL